MATCPDVPGRLPVGIETHGYQIEPTGFRRETVQVIRQQADTSTEPGEQTLSPLGLWRRSQESWHHGAGQNFLDGKQGDAPVDPHRFRSSKGVDPWAKGQLSLLHPTIKSWETTNTNLFLTVAQESGGVFIPYVADGTNLYFAGLPFNLFNSLALQTGTGWSASNATIGPGLGAGTTFFRVTATAAAAVSVTSPTGLSGRPVEGGRRYGFAVQTAYASGGAARVPQLLVTWYDAAGAVISSTAPAVAAGTDGSGVNVITNAVAPTNAAFASLTISWTTNWANGEIHDVIVVSIGPHDIVSTLGAPDGWFSCSIQAGEAAQPIQSLATNGSYVWAALGTSGLHRTFAAGSMSTANVPAAPVSGQISLVGYANGFLLAAGSTTSTTGKNTLWVVNDPLGTPSLSVLKTHPNSLFAWTFIASGRNCVYAGGNSGGNGEIYKILFDPNTGTLSSAASPASFLPEGETIHSLYFYAGGVILGTGRGVRIGQADGAGNIDYGPLISTDWPVRCLEPQDRYCWFGWTKYDDGTSGLGRIDLGFLTDTLTPAWASDLMTPDATQGDIVSCLTFAPYGYTENQRPPVRMFSVAGEGVYIEDPYSRVPQGRLETGTIRFATSEPKLTRSIDLRHHALPSGGTIAVEMQRDSEGAYGAVLGTSNVADSYGPASSISLGDEEVEAMEFRFTFSQPDPDGEDFTRTPEMTRWTAKVLPLPSTIDETFTIPIIMRREVVDNNDSNFFIDVDAEVAYLKGLERSRELVNLQLGDEQHTVYLLGSEFQGQNWGPGKEFIEGILVTQWQTARG